MSDCALPRTIRASDGVISGRSVTSVCSLSTNEYICCVISSPALRLYSSWRSKTGASYSSNPHASPTARKWSKSQRCRRISSG